MAQSDVGTVGVVWRGDPAAALEDSRYWARLVPVLDGLRHAGLQPRPLLYREDVEDEFRGALATCRGVLVWVNPVADGADRRRLDELLAEVSRGGSWISAHPTTIAAIGTKRVLVATQDLTWGVEASELSSREELLASLEAAASCQSTRVLKPLRGNGGSGVWKVVPSRDGRTGFTVQSAERRDDTIEHLTTKELVRRVAPAFDAGGTVIDQLFVDSARSGMVRTYVSVDRVVGFATQSPAVVQARDEHQDDPVFAMASAKTMYEADEARFHPLRSAVEGEWIPELQRRFGLSADDLPAIWDLDFLHRPDGSGYVLCEINTSCVSPFPDAAVPAIVACALARCS